MCGQEADLNEFFPLLIHSYKLAEYIINRLCRYMTLLHCRSEIIAVDSSLFPIEVQRHFFSVSFYNQPSGIKPSKKETLLC